MEVNEHDGFLRFFLELIYPKVPWPHSATVRDGCYVLPTLVFILRWQLPMTRNSFQEYFSVVLF